MLLILAVFAGSHSGLAYLRPYGELLHQQPPIGYASRSICDN